MKTPKTDCALNVYKDKEFYQLGFHLVDLENAGFPATLKPVVCVLFLFVCCCFYLFCCKVAPAGTHVSISA